MTGMANEQLDMEAVAIAQLKAEELVFTVTNFRDWDDIDGELTPRLEQAFTELFKGNPGGESRHFPFEASNGVKIDFRKEKPAVP
jgi:hypothetical protein